MIKIEEVLIVFGINKFVPVWLQYALYYWTPQFFNNEYYWLWLKFYRIHFYWLVLKVGANTFNEKIYFYIANKQSLSKVNRYHFFQILVVCLHGFFSVQGY